MWAFPRRSNYDQTYGNSSDRSRLASARDKTKTDAQAIKNYRRQLVEYQRRLAAYRKANNDVAALLPNETAPAPPRRTASAEEETLVRHANSRDKNEILIGYPLDAEGAVRGVRAGETPAGVPAILREYKPQ
ncbi:hypothetical protein D3C78_1424340 [compost metagenome]